MPLIFRLMANGFFVWSFPGALGGFLLALEIKRHGPKLGGRDVAWITAGWALGFAFGGAAGRAVDGLVSPGLLTSNDPLWLTSQIAAWLSFGITGLIAGAMGAWVMGKVIKAEYPTPL